MNMMVVQPTRYGMTCSAGLSTLRMAPVKFQMAAEEHGVRVATSSLGSQMCSGSNLCPSIRWSIKSLGEAGTLWVDPQDGHAPGAVRDGPVTCLHGKHPDTAQKHHPPTSTNSRKQAAIYGLAAHSSGAFHVGGFLKSVQSGITAVGAAAISWLPPLLRRALSASDSSSVASDHTDEHLGEGHQAVKKEMLVGHLLSLITDGHLPAVPKHLLPALASQLTEAGLLKEWVRWLLVSQPALFNRAFERLFKEEASPAVSVSMVVCSPHQDHLSAENALTEQVQGVF